MHLSHHIFMYFNEIRVFCADGYVFLLGCNAAVEKNCHPQFFFLILLDLLLFFLNNFIVLGIFKVVGFLSWCIHGCYCCRNGLTAWSGKGRGKCFWLIFDNFEEEIWCLLNEEKRPEIIKTKLTYAFAQNLKIWKEGRVINDGLWEVEVAWDFEDQYRRQIHSVSKRRRRRTFVNKFI